MLQKITSDDNEEDRVTRRKSVEFEEAAEEMLVWRVGFKQLAQMCLQMLSRHLETENRTEGGPA